jgi:hypothetical protein
VPTCQFEGFGPLKADAQKEQLTELIALDLWFGVGSRSRSSQI